MSVLRRIWVEFLTALLFVAEFGTNILRFVKLGRRYYRGSNRIDGKVVVITGANSGIGKETALQLSNRGAKVILCCRSQSSGQSAMQDIRRQNGDALVQVMQLDLASIRSVNQFADRLSRQEKKVDILVNNAGVMMCPYSKSEDNFELQFATNHLGHFLLTKRLLPLLANSSDGRILNVSSVHHVRGQIFFDDINFEKPNSYDPVEAYCQSKMANVLFTRQLAKRLSQNPAYRNVKCYALNPGTINTNLSRHVSGVRRVLFDVIGALFNLDISTGTQTTLYCALEPSLHNQSGHYYSNCKLNKCIFKESTDDRAARELWIRSCQMTDIEPDQY